MANHATPGVFFESLNLAKALQEGRVTPEVIRADSTAMEAMQNGEVPEEYMRSMRGLPFYMSHSQPAEDSSAIAFDRHFNPSLKHDSQYFKDLNALLQCVDNNSGKTLTVEEQNAVCADEMKQVRLSAFKKELMYHNVNKRFFMDLITFKRGESPY